MDDFERLMVMHVLPISSDASSRGDFVLDDVIPRSEARGLVVGLLRALGLLLGRVIRRRFSVC